MPALRSLLLATLLGSLVVPASASAQSDGFERRPYLVLNGGFGVQGSGEASTSSALAGPQVSIGVGARLARAVALRAEYGGQWFLRGAEPVYTPCAPAPAPCFGTTRAEDLRAAHLLAELRLRDRSTDRGLAYLLAGPSLLWSPDNQASPDAIFTRGAQRAAGATVGFGFGLRSAPRSDRSVRIEARYTALTHAAAATHGLVGVVLGIWI